MFGPCWWPHGLSRRSVGLFWRGIEPSQRPVPNTAQPLPQTGIHATGGIRTRNPIQRAAVDPRLRPRGNWDRKYGSLFSTLFSTRFNYDIKNNYFLTKSKTFLKANSLISEGLLQWQCAVLLCAASHTKTFTAIEGCRGEKPFVLRNYKAVLF